MASGSKQSRRIVSKKAYAQKISAKTTLAFFGLSILLFGLVCGAFALIIAIFMMLNVSVSSLLVFLFMTALFGGGSAVLLYFGGRTIKEAAEIDTGVPLTRANSGDLPAPDSLVRASIEPVQTLQTVLLRAATSADTTPAEQLVRAYQEPALAEQTVVLQPETSTPVTITASAEATLVEQRLA